MSLKKTKNRRVDQEIDTSFTLRVFQNAIVFVEQILVFSKFDFQQKIIGFRTIILNVLQFSAFLLRSPGIFIFYFLK